jgi:1-aminocyclopropane-1-carboxylate deaminase/D-cysteine desulfhydrase-like pyridoxal-dependent ACC family enzyme
MDTALKLRPIYAALPGLEKVLPCAGFAALPTPVQACDFGAQQVWIKRDDLSHADYGGNKVRKLELILAAAQAAGQTRMVTFGATGTHHGLATAIFCRKLGLACEVLLFDQPDSASVQRNLQRLQEEGAQRVFCGSLANTLLRFYLHPRRLRRDTHFLFAGGSNELGVLAFVNAALELKLQIDDGLCVMPQRVYCPVGSGSTIAGLTLGMALANLPTQVIGVRVADSHLGPIPACTVSTINALMQRTLRWLDRRGIAWPAAVATPQLDERWIGAGYGHATVEAQRAAEVFQASMQIPLDLTYTAKAFAAVLHDSQQAATSSSLYWHTLSSA